MKGNQVGQTGAIVFQSTEVYNEGTVYFFEATVKSKTAKASGQETFAV